MLPIRQYGDPVLKQATRELDEIDGRVAKLVDDMLDTMYAAPGVGLAANQVGVQRRLFVYDIGDGPQVIINPRVIETSGEWTFEEGCLSVPGLSWQIVRPNRIHLVGLDLDGNELSIEAEEYQGRVLQHEVDHLDGALLIDRLDEDQRRDARRILRARRGRSQLARPPGREPPPLPGAVGQSSTRRTPPRRSADLASSTPAPRAAARYGWSR